MFAAIVTACSSGREPPAEPDPPGPPGAPGPSAEPRVPAPPRSSNPAAFWSSLPELPPGTFDVYVRTESLEEEPAELAWAWAASRICHEYDPFTFPTPSREHHVREGLLCGRAVIEHVPGLLRAFTLEVNREAHPIAPLFAVRTTLAIEDVLPLVVGFHKEAVGDTTVLCSAFDPSSLPDPSPDSCARGRNPHDRAVAIVDGYLVGGDYLALADLLTWPGRERLLSLLPDLGARPGLELDLLPRGASWQLGPRRFLPFSRDEALPLGAAIRRDARAVIIDPRWGLGRFSLTLVPRCTDNACPERARLADAVRSYQQAWATHAMERLEEVFQGGDPCSRPLERAMVEAASKAKVTTDALVELRITTTHPVDPACGADERRRTAEAIARVRAALPAR